MTGPVEIDSRREDIRAIALAYRAARAEGMSHAEAHRSAESLYREWHPEATDQEVSTAVVRIVASAARLELG
jgi:hypothetical protein